MIEDDGFETVIGLDTQKKKKKYKVEVEGVVTRTYEVEAENSAKAAQLGRSEFVIEFGGNKYAIHICDIWKD